MGTNPTEEVDASYAQWVPIPPAAKLPSCSTTLMGTNPTGGEAAVLLSYLEYSSKQRVPIPPTKQTLAARSGYQSHRRRNCRLIRLPLIMTLSVDLIIMALILALFLDRSMDLIIMALII